MKHTAIYLRVSSKEQDTASQEHDMARWIDNQDCPMITYRDSASGKSMDRAGWNELWEQAKLGEVERIVIWRLDRLGRTASGLTALFDDLVERQIGLVSIRDSFDLTQPAGRLMANILASVAFYENEVRRERQAAGIAAAKAKGKKWGGWKHCHPTISLTPRKLRVIQDMWESGASKQSIRRATGLAWSTVRYAIKEEKWKKLRPRRKTNETNSTDDADSDVLVAERD